MRLFFHSKPALFPFVSVQVVSPVDRASLCSRPVFMALGSLCTRDVGIGLCWAVGHAWVLLRVTLVGRRDQVEFRVANSM